MSILFEYMHIPRKSTYEYKHFHLVGDFQNILNSEGLITAHLGTVTSFIYSICTKVALPTYQRYPDGGRYHGTVFGWQHCELKCQACVGTSEIVKTRVGC